MSMPAGRLPTPHITRMSKVVSWHASHTYSQNCLGGCSGYVFVPYTSLRAAWSSALSGTPAFVSVLRRFAMPVTPPRPSRIARFSSPCGSSSIVSSLSGDSPNPWSSILMVTCLPPVVESSGVNAGSFTQLGRRKLPPGPLDSDDFRLSGVSSPVKADELPRLERPANASPSLAIRNRRAAFLTSATFFQCSFARSDASGLFAPLSAMLLTFVSAADELVSTCRCLLSSSNSSSSCTSAGSTRALDDALGDLGDDVLLKTANDNRQD